jgi:hypothetical protein
MDIYLMACHDYHCFHKLAAAHDSLDRSHFYHWFGQDIPTMLSEMDVEKMELSLAFLFGKMYCFKKNSHSMNMAVLQLRTQQME